MTTVDEFHDSIMSPTIRIELSPTMNLTQGTTVETARVFVLKPNGRWRKVDPLLLPKEGGGRADLLEDLARIARGQVVS